MENNTDSTAGDLESRLLDISVPDFDRNYNTTRRQLVRQRFMLGLVQMFEQFPDLPSVEFCFGENVASMIRVPDTGNMAAKDYVSLNTKVKKALQKTRAAISPQTRDTASALEWFFTPAPRTSSNTVVLERWLFSRRNLARLCDPEMVNLKEELIATVKKELLEEVAQAHSPDSRAVQSASTPKL